MIPPAIEPRAIDSNVLHFNSDASLQHRGVFSLNRLLFVSLAWVGFLSLFLGTRLDWFAVPIAAPQSETPFSIVDSTPGCTVWFQAALAVILLCLGTIWFRKRYWTNLCTFLACIAFLLPLSYPFFVVIRSPQVSADAAWLQMQHDNLTWLGGDIYTNAEFGSKGWKAKTYLVDAPNQLAVVSLPSWSPWEVGLHRCNDLAGWLGYSNAFCQFAGMGWGLTLFGSGTLLLVTLQKKGTLKYHRAGAAIVLFTLSAGAAAAIAWSLPFRASQNIQAAAECCSKQDFEGSRYYLERAVSLLPVLGQDTNYIAQRGILDLRLQIDSEYAQLSRANSLEKRGRYDQAYALIRQLIDSEDPAIRRESLRSVLRFAIQDYNSARFDLSYQRFSLVLRHHPCDVKLIYLMQLQGIREARLTLVEAMRDKMYVACEKLNFGTKKVLRAASEQHCVIATGMTEDAMAIWAAQSKAK